MCGIAGILNTDGQPIPADALARMTRILAHRGPDDEGTWAEGPVGFGHRRLAIIDLTAAAHQPMQAQDGKTVITYNGEAYNFREIRSELQRLGHTFRSDGDAEVVLEAYRQWGPASVERLNGMFAFAIWDHATATLFLARDRYGIKPLYYTWTGETFLFASEIKALLQHPGVRPRPSPVHLLEYFTFQNVFTDGTLFQGIRMLPPGCHAVLSMRSSKLRSTRYWDFRFAEAPDDRTSQEVEDELDRLFSQAVRRQLVSDVSVGSYLSGGIDSGAITAIAAREHQPFRTFTVGFDVSSVSGLEVGFDERRKAEALSYHCKTQQYEVVLKSGDMERCLPELTWHLEDLRVGQSYPNLYASTLAGKFVKVALSGTGGDELFGGYPWRYYRGMGGKTFDEYIDRYYVYWHRLIPNRYISQLFTPEIWREIKDVRTIDIFRDVFDKQTSAPSTPEEHVNRSLYFEAKTFLRGLFLVEDKLSMAHGLEVRVPFMDNDLVDFALRLPVRFKLEAPDAVIPLDENEPGPKSDKYFQRTRDGKILMRRALRRYLPAHLTDQAKQGFSAPDASWFRGDSIDYVRRIVYDERSRMYDFLQPKTVQPLVDEHLSGRVNRRLFIWPLLNFEWWCRIFLHGDISTGPRTQT